MTDKTDREIMQQALEALNYISRRDYDDTPLHDYELEKMRPAMSTLRERLAQPEQKPVAWLSTDSIGERYLWFSKPLDNDKAQRLYTAPQKREWQGLTKEEMQKLAETNLVYQPESYEWSGVFDLLRAVSEKLKEKND